MIPNVGFHSAGQSKTPADSSECSPELSESFLEQFAVFPEHQFDLWRKSALSGGSKTRLSELGPEVMNLRKIFGEKP